MPMPPTRRLLKVSSVTAVGAALSLVLTAASSADTSTSARVVRLAMASSAADTGLGDWLRDDFSALHPGIAVDVRSVGALQTLDLARRGEADVVITHHPPSEDLFLQDGWAVHRTLLMANDFAFFAPPGSPVQANTAAEARAALRQLARDQVPFVSPAAHSGTALKLQELWTYAGVTSGWTGYEMLPVSSKEALRTAADTGAYAFSDLATWLALRAEIGSRLVPVLRDQAALRNVYSVMPVAAAKAPGARQDIALMFTDYLLSDRGQERLARFVAPGADTQLFTPAARLDAGLQARLAAAALAEQHRHVMLLVAAAMLALAGAAGSAWMWQRAAASERRHRRSEQRYARAVAATQDGVWEWDLAEDRAGVSRRFFELLRVPRGPWTIDEICDLWTQRVHPDDRPGFERLLSAVRRGDIEGPFEIDLRQADADATRWIRVRGSRDSTPAPGAGHVSGTISDITAQRERDRFMHEALHDSLTGLPNRTYLNERLARVAQAAAGDCAVLWLDLDAFKPINDRLGHAVGDAVLAETARRLKDAVRGTDVVARIGGDEFVILLPDTAESAALPVMRHLESRITQPMRVSDQMVSVGVSFGLAMLARHAYDVDAVLGAADAAMYAEKRQRAGRATEPAAGASVSPQAQPAGLAT